MGVLRRRSAGHSGFRRFGTFNDRLALAAKNLGFGADYRRIDGLGDHSLYPNPSAPFDLKGQMQFGFRLRKGEAAVLARGLKHNQGKMHLSGCDILQ